MTVATHGAFSYAQEESTRVHVALAQVCPNGSVRGEIDAILPKLAELAREAVDKGADILILPEYFLSGAHHDAWKHASTLPALDEHARAPWVAQVAQIARTAQIAIVTGSAVELRTFPSRPGLFNTCYFIDHFGTVLGEYTKRHLWHPERRLLSAATDETHPTSMQPHTFLFKTKRGLTLRAAMVMCWDLMFPETFRVRITPPKSASDLDLPGEWVGPDIVFSPTCWYANDSGTQALQINPACEQASLDAIVPCRAMETECFVCMCNTAGPDVQDGEPFGLGRSTCAAPILGAYARVPHNRETLLLATLDTTVLRTARDIFKVRQDLADALRMGRKRNKEAKDTATSADGDTSFVLDTHSDEVPLPCQVTEPATQHSPPGLDLPGHVAVVASESVSSAAREVTQTADDTFEQLDAAPHARYYEAEADEKRRLRN
ncbi:hypothetical protein MVES1_003656 [Malassezia vespertilionis]|nr:uncharacterized protein MVES1_003656 [Malassezia vespertilionis]WFD08284.1 hypothetical protein MVES1_003656 [Malassezia vespertilionis]